MKRTNLKNVAAIVACLAVTTMFSGCAVYNSQISSSSAPFYLAYDTDEIIRDQSKVATITSNLGLEINGVWVTPQNMRSANAGNGNKRVVVADVLPGEYKVRIDPKNIGAQTTSSNIGSGYNTPITYNFEAGRIYNLEQITLVVRVKENTSPEVARKIAENRNNAVFESKK